MFGNTKKKNKGPLAQAVLSLFPCWMQFVEACDIGSIELVIATGLATGHTAIVLVISCTSRFQPVLLCASSFRLTRLFPTWLVSSWIHLVCCFPLLCTPSVLPNSYQFHLYLSSHAEIDHFLFQKYCLQG